MKILIGLLLFGVFWMISTPIYIAVQIVDWLDERLDQVLKVLWEDS